jgi:N-acetylneuraminate lyase
MITPPSFRVVSNIIIPFDRTGTFAPDRLSTVLSAQRTGGPDAFLVGADPIEKSERELQFRKLLFERVAADRRAKTSLIADVNASSPDTGARLARIADDLGFDAISLCLSVATIEGLLSGLTFVRAVATATSMPIYLRIFDRPRLDETLDQFIRLIGNSRIAGVLVYCQDPQLLNRLHNNPRRPVIYCGLEETLTAHLNFGPGGVVSHLANFLAPLFRETQAAVAQDDIFRAMDLQKLTQGFIDAARGIGMVAATKGWMSLLGVDCGPCRGVNGCLTDTEWMILAGWLEAYLLHESAPLPSVRVCAPLGSSDPPDRDRSALR